MNDLKPTTRHPFGQKSTEPVKPPKKPGNLTGVLKKYALIGAGALAVVGGIGYCSSQNKDLDKTPGLTQNAQKPHFPLFRPAASKASQQDLNLNTVLAQERASLSKSLDACIVAQTLEKMQDPTLTLNTALEAGMNTIFDSFAHDINNPAARNVGHLRTLTILEPNHAISTDQGNLLGAAVRARFQTMEAFLANHTKAEATEMLVTFGSLCCDPNLSKTVEAAFNENPARSGRISQKIAEKTKDKIGNGQPAHAALCAAVRESSQQDPNAKDPVPTMAFVGYMLSNAALSGVSPHPMTQTKALEQEEKRQAKIPWGTVSLVTILGALSVGGIYASVKAKEK